MYQIEKKPYGYKITYNGFFKMEDTQKLYEDVKKTLETQSGKFCVLNDLREMKPLPPEAQKIGQQMLQLFLEKGMERSINIMKSKIAAMQGKRISKETGIDKFERYIDASNDPNWEKKAEDWLIKGIDPYEA